MAELVEKSEKPTKAKYQPSDFLKAVLGRPVRVKLNSGVEYRGWNPVRSTLKEFSRPNRTQSFVCTTLSFASLETFESFPIGHDLVSTLFFVSPRWVGTFFAHESQSRSFETPHTPLGRHPRVSGRLHEHRHGADRRARQRPAQSKVRRLLHPRQQRCDSHSLALHLCKFCTVHYISTIKRAAR